MEERIWSLVENAGLLPEIAWKDELAAEAEKAAKLEEEMYGYEDEFDVDEYEPSDEEILGNTKTFNHGKKTKKELL